MNFDLTIDYDAEEGVEWVQVARLSMGRGTVVHWKGHVDGKCKYSRVIWQPDAPDDPPPMDMAA